MAVLAPLAIAATIGSGVMGAVGALQQGHAAQQAANYNAAVQMQNSEQAKRNAEIASQSGMANQEAQELKNRAIMGSIKANQGASGVEVGTGSFADVQESANVIGEMDSLAVRNRATREAYGYQVQETDFQNKATLEREEGKNAKTASYFSAASTLLGSAGSASSQYMQYKRGTSL